jgi:hypothetical protein
MQSVLVVQNTNFSPNSSIEAIVDLWESVTMIFPNLGCGSHLHHTIVFEGNFNFNIIIDIVIVIVS